MRPLRWFALGVAAAPARHWTALAALPLVAGAEITGAGAEYLP